MAERSGFSRRRLLGAGAVAGAGLAVTTSACARSAPEPVVSDVVPFHGRHQAGVATPPQAYATFIAFDLTPGHDDRASVASIMKLWTEDAARLTQGVPALADTEPELATQPSRLTVTVGFGPSLFDKVGLASHQPRSLDPLPHFATDRIEPRWGGADLLLQVCAEDLAPISHACRVLTKNVRSMATVRWIQRGYHNPPGAPPGASMRNLMGQVDGTVNLTESTELDSHVWDDGTDRPWFAGGTVLVLRRIRAELDEWDKVDRRSKELTVGRRLDNGAPLTGQVESDEADFDLQHNGISVIPPNSHIALARHHSDAEQFLRRPYNYDDTPGPGQTSDSGLLFAAFQRDPATQFIPVQQRLSDFDALNPWITTVGSAVFAVLPGVEPGRYLGQQLLEPG